MSLPQKFSGRWIVSASLSTVAVVVPKLLCLALALLEYSSSDEAGFHLDFRIGSLEIYLGNRIRRESLEGVKL